MQDRQGDGMLSVLIETHNDEDRLARTLASLVSGAVEGLVREVIVCDRGSTDQSWQVADHAGCVWLAGTDIAAGIARAKGDWLLFVEPGARLSPGWTEPVLRHISEADGPARFNRTRSSEEALLSRIFATRRPLAEGLVISRPQAASLAKPGMDCASIARKVKARRLSGEISAAPRH
ncbi:MAG TPA: glycosyltransferase [Rhizobiaceae bacterium]|nr:glycosyltransferase [Rhizobiaceae bacterium]